MYSGAEEKIKLVESSWQSVVPYGRGKSFSYSLMILDCKQSKRNETHMWSSAGFYMKADS